MANDTFDFSEVVDSFEMTEQEDSTTPIEEAPDAFPAFNEEPEAMDIFEKIAKGDKGDPGEPGKNFTVLGIVETVDDLPETAVIGDCYLVGTEPPYIGYILTESGWANVGALQGPQGETGPQGPQGPQGETGATGPRGPSGDLYGLCSTASNVANKVVEIQDFELVTGVTIHVKFRYKNTASGPTLNVNDTGAYPIHLYSADSGSPYVVPGSAASTWETNSVVSLTFDGYSWAMNDRKDTHYKHELCVCNTANGTVDTAATSGNTYVNLYRYHEATPSLPTVTDSLHLVPGDGLEISNDANHNIEFRLKLLDLVYPVGSIYMSVNNVSPATLFGGTWEQIEDMFLLAAGQTYAAGTQGGHANAIVPYHTHTTEKGGAFTFTVRAIGRASGAYQVTANSGVTDAVSGASQRYVSSNDGTTTGTNVQDRIVHSGHNHTVNYAGTSGNATGANMPPYVAVYVWKRVQDTVEER